MSHEIRTPMNAIIGMSHLLADTNLTRQQHDYLLNIDDSANSLLHIIDEILDYSKLEAGRYLLESAHLDLEDLLERIGKRASVKAERAGLEYVCDIAPDVPRFIKGDALRLKQVLNNLLDNAVKFTPAGSVTLQVLCTQDDELEFAVRDTGIGIPPEQLSQLFEPFAQLDGSTSRRFGGSGLGLTICQYLVEQMGGQLSIDSEPGQGSCFRFRARFEASHLGARPLHQQAGRYQDLRVLLVDDNPQVCVILGKIARALQLHASTATSGEQALHMLQQACRDGRPYQLVVVDFKMPQLDGVETCAAIRTNSNISPKPRQVLLSNYSRSDISQEHSLHGIDAFLHKPVTASRLFDAIANAFGHRLFEQEGSETSASNPLQGVHVLLAEDNPVNQKVALGILQKRGMQVAVAGNGREALALLHQYPCGHFAVILMDMEMPEVDGYQATREIRNGEHSPDIPIIAMTAHALPGDRERCLAAGMNDYISKPVNPGLLYQTLTRYVAQPTKPC